MSVVLRPETLRHVCKEPLANVQTVQLRGREITRLVGLSVCPNLTSLDISYNALTELESKCFEGCKELWIVDASHNRLESVGGLSSLMALGYLNLSSNPLPLEALRPLAHAHILELFLGSVRSGEERRRTLGLLPNVWVLDDDYVTARERRAAEDDYSHGDGEREDHLLRTWNDSSLLRPPENLLGDDGASGRQIESRNITVRTTHGRPQPKKEAGGGSGFGSLETQGRYVRDFYENVVWKLPARTDAADTSRLATLLERYDKRTAAANTSAWIGSFTSGGVGGGVRGCVRRDWSFPAPRPHLDALMSLPLELKLDVAVLLAVRATLWNSIPQQVLEEALMVLLILQGGLSGGIHSDLSRVPAFICTALVHVLRSSILRLLDQNSMPGHSDTTAPPLLDRQQADLLEALPPVVTGVDVDGTFEAWQRSSLVMKDPARKRGEGGRESVGCPGGEIEWEGGAAAEDLLDGGRDVLARVDLSLAHNAAAAADPVVETRLPAVTVERDGTPPTYSSAEEEETTTRQATAAVSAAAGSTFGVGMEQIRSDGGLEMPAATGLPKAGEGAAAAAAAEAVDTSPGYFDVYTPPSGVGLTRLCRRGVILLTRSPACPDLVAWQTHPTEQRTYDQMEPLLARANMTHKDLYPRLSMHHERKVELARSSLKSSRQYLPSTPSLEFGPSPTAGETGQWRGDANDHQPRNASQSSEDGFWSANIRRPKAGERVQVLHDTWSVIVALHPDTFSILVAPFEGMQLPPYRGDSCVDSRDLFYDPRGWWRHAPSLTMNPSTGPGRLHRLARGISATGLPWGAGSLNEPLAEDKVDEWPSSGGGRETTADDGEIRAPALIPRPGMTTTSTACRTTVAASCNPPLAPAAVRHGVRTGNNVVGIFSAEGAWDPVFVMAPPRLVGLQNQTAARKRGRRRARQVAWRRIDRPEASLAPRPMMPRCSSLPAPAEASDSRSRFLKRSASILGLPDDRSCPRLATVAPSHGGSSSYLWSALSKSSSVPSINTPPSSHSAAAVDQKTAISGDGAWLDLQREMGSLRADNRMFVRGNPSGGGGRQGNVAHPLRAAGSAASVLSKSVAEEVSTVCAEATTDLLAKTLSLGLDSPNLAWKEDKPTTVFELTQVDGEPERSSASSTVTATNVSSPRGGNPAEEKSQPGTKQRSTACSTRGAEGGGGRESSTAPETTKPTRNQGRAPRDGDSATATTASRTWKPNAHRPLDWFPVPGRQILLVDPNDVKATTEAAADEAAAAAGAAGRLAERRPSSGVEDDLRPGEKSAVGDRGSGNNGNAKGRGGGGRAEHRRDRRPGEPRDKAAGRREEGKQGRSAKPRQPDGGHGEHAVQEDNTRLEIVLSARSALQSAAASVVTPTDAEAGARATTRAQSLSGSRRARPHTSASRAWGRHKADAHSGGVKAQKSSTAKNIVVSHPQKKERVDILRHSRAPEASHRETPCASMSALGGGAVADPQVASWRTRISPFAPNERQGETARAGSGGPVEVGKSSPHRQRKAEAAVMASPTSKEGGLQIQRLPARNNTATAANRASLTVRQETAVAPGLLRNRRHPSRGTSRAAISGWEGEETSTVRQPQDRRTASGGMGRTRGRGGAKMLPTTLRSDNISFGDTFSLGSANSSISSYCGWNKTSNSQN